MLIASSADPLALYVNLKESGVGLWWPWVETAQCTQMSLLPKRSGLMLQFLFFVVFIWERGKVLKQTGAWHVMMFENTEDS